MANTYVLIASNTLTSSAASVTFSSIPGTYTDLVIRTSTRDSNDGRDIRLTFNSDSSLLYSRTRLEGDGSSTNSGQNSNQARIMLDNAAVGSTYTANTFSNQEIYIPSYAASQNKPVGVFGVVENNATVGFINVFAGLYRSTTAITSITLTHNEANFVSGSSFWLYGIKKD